MVSNAAYRIIKKAVILRVEAGEKAENILESYPKLSDEQKIQMLNELISEGYIPAE